MPEVLQRIECRFQSIFGDSDFKTYTKGNPEGKNGPNIFSVNISDRSPASAIKFIITTDTVLVLCLVTFVLSSSTPLSLDTMYFDPGGEPHIIFQSLLSLQTIRVQNLNVNL